MKRILTLLAAISMVLSAMAQTAGITLAYNKGEKMLFYPANKLAQAIEDAKPNDILYFSAGSYNLGNLPRSNYGNGYEITKPLTFIGAGAFDNDKGTYFYSDGNLYLNLEKSQDNSDVKFAFEGIKLSNTLCVDSNIDELVFRNFQGSITTNYNEESEFLIGNLLVDRCNLHELNLIGDHVNKANVNNTIIEERIYGGCVIPEKASEGSLLSLDHCRIKYVDSSFVGNIKNSFLQDVSGSSASLDYCGYHNAPDAAKTNSFEIPYGTWYDKDDNPSEYGTCSDGETPYGTSGGITPYSLYSSYPTPDPQESSFDYDKISNTLTITVKLKGSEDTDNN